MFKDKKAQVLYVGKAKNLKARVSQYFGHDQRPQLPYLMAEAVDVDYIVVGTELESLFLENTLIKQYLPPYNIKLRDDKNYAFIKIDYSTQIPQITYVRKVDEDQKTHPSLTAKRYTLTAPKYFGPYSSTRKIKETLDFIRRVFPYCANKEIGKRPCFYYFLHRCPGICAGAMSMEDYYKQIDRIALFLSGKTAEIRKNLQADMKTAARKKQFETAARLRDQLRAINILDERHLTQFAKNVSWDFVSVWNEYGSACVNLFKVREGKLIDKETFIYEDGKTRAKLEESTEPVDVHSAVLQRFLEEYYASASQIPQEIYLETEAEQSELIKQLLRSRAGKNIPVSVPTRGQKLKLINLGKLNAQEFLRKWQNSQANNLDTLHKALEELQKVLKLPVLPRRIEGYDISNIQGTNPVGSMVVFVDGKPAKGEYRKFKIKIKDTPDDFAMMEEMLSRRLRHLKNQESGIRNQKKLWPEPDLIVIDGGKGQLGAAQKALKKSLVVSQESLVQEHDSTLTTNDYRLTTIPMIGLAKRIEEIFLPNKSHPIILAHDNPALQLLQRLRDEAHRFAITFHRQLRSRAATKSALDTISGIGPKTKKLLKAKFGTVANIKNADSQALVEIVGPAKTKLLKKLL